MKKYVLSIGFLIVLLGLLSACENKMATNTYTYENEAVLNIQIEKTEVYDDSIVITFAEDSLSDVEKVECFSSDFSVIEDDADFSFQNDVLTIETDHADMISGIKVWESRRDLYFCVRYLDSDSYAMLVYSWAEDAGYIATGDEDAFYTQAEKDQQRELAEKQEEAQNLAFRKLQGEWLNESEDTRIVFDVTAANTFVFMT